jgi:RNase adapter protein RapZ
VTATPLELAVITGMSGAGRSTAADVLEDLGYFVVENLPPDLLPVLVDSESARGDAAHTRLAVAVDVRGGIFVDRLRVAIEELSARGIVPRVLFLEADDAALVRRFEMSRRPHPLQPTGRVLDAIEREREVLGPLRADADAVIDTSVLNVHELAAKVRALFGERADETLRATVVSFGFRYGLPADADFVSDVRFLPNPHWIPELQPQTGKDPGVAAYVFEHPEAQQFLDNLQRLLGATADGFIGQGKYFTTIAIGCTGGRHRSVAMAERLTQMMRDNGVETLLVHRDVDRG